ncbi:hypothetical protein AYI70_g5245, partial [Smittium culicis]
MTLQGQKVDSTDQYTYLGYIMNSKWDVSGTIKNNMNKVRKAVYAAYSFLRRSDVLTTLKIKFINSPRATFWYKFGLFRQSLTFAIKLKPVKRARTLFSDVVKGNDPHCLTNE